MMSARSASCSQRTATVSGSPAVGVPKWRRSSSTASCWSGSAGVTSTVGRPIAAFSSSGVPSATIWPRWMIPTRSARTSASSRYCVVRKTVTPSPLASRPTSLQSAVRLCGSSPVVGSSRNRMLGSCTSASARSRRRFIPPEYPLILRSAARVSPTRSRSSVLRRFRTSGESPWSEAWRRRCSRPVRNGSSAASCRAAPIEARTCGPCLTMSNPATRAVRKWAGGGSSACARSSTCRRRSGRGTRRSRRARSAGRSRRRP